MAINKKMLVKETGEQIYPETTIAQVDGLADRLAAIEAKLVGTGTPGTIDTLEEATALLNEGTLPQLPANADPDQYLLSVTKDAQGNIVYTWVLKSSIKSTTEVIKLG